MKSVIDIFRLQATQRANQKAFTFLDEQRNEVCRTYSAIYRESSAFANKLLEQCNAGDRVCILLPSGLDYVRVFLACLMAGLVAVPLYPAKGAKSHSKIRKIIDDCGAKVVVSESSTVARIASLSEDAVKWLDIAELSVADAGQLIDLDVNINSHDLAFLQYTSGSTGDPKGVMISHQNILANIGALRQAIGAEFASDICSWLPLNHDMGMMLGILAPLYRGGHSVLMPQISFVMNPFNWFTTISEFNIVCSAAPNFAFKYCVERIDVNKQPQVDLSAWKMCINGAEPIDKKVLDAFIEKFSVYGVKKQLIYPAYGLAEATVFVSGGVKGENFKTQSLDRLALQNNKVEPSSATNTTIDLVGCGKAQDLHCIKIVEANGSAELAEQRVGEICVSGPSIATGYWRKPSESKAVFDFKLAGQSYLRTGDLGFLADGELYITGRKKELIIINGRNYYPRDIEATASGADQGLALSIVMETGDALTIIQEVKRQYIRELDFGSVKQRIQSAVFNEHELIIGNIVFVRESKLPLTSSGKIQRKLALDMFVNNQFEFLHRKTKRKDTGGLTDSEKKLLAIWVDLLDQPTISIDDSFFDLGGDSLFALKATSEINQQFKLNLSLEAIFHASNIRNLAAEIDIIVAEQDKYAKVSQQHDADAEFDEVVL